MNKLNKSFIYLFPLIYREIINESEIDPDIFYKENWLPIFVNSYCITDIPGQIALKIYSGDASDKFLEIIKNSSIFASLSTIDIYTTVFINIPTAALISYDNFIRGKYSKIQDDDKKIIVKFCKSFLFQGNGKDAVAAMNMVTDILYKNPKRAEILMHKFGINKSDWNPEWELSSIINEDEETFKI